MIIREIHISAFGRHVDLTLKPEEGFNLVCTGNEGGKTTLLHFIQACFYGMANKSQDLSKYDRQRYLPWHAPESRYGGFIRFEHKGREYRLERFFGQTAGKDRVTLTDAVTGTPVPLNRQEPGQKLFGMSQNEFMNTVYIGQMSTAVSSDENIRRRLASLSAGGSLEFSPEEMVRRLTDQRRDLKAFRGDGGRIFELQTAVRELEEEAVQAKRLQSERLQREEELTEASDRLDQAVEERDRLEEAEERRRLQQLIRQRTELETRIEELKHLEEQVAEGRQSLGLPEGASLPAQDAVNMAQHALTRWESLEEQLQKTEESLAKIKAEMEEAPRLPEVEQLLERRQELRQDLRALAADRRKWSEDQAAEARAFEAETAALQKRLMDLEAEASTAAELEQEKKTLDSFRSAYEETEEQAESLQGQLPEAKAALQASIAQREQAGRDASERREALVQRFAAEEAALEEGDPPFEADDVPAEPAPKRDVTLLLVGGALLIVAVVLLILFPSIWSGILLAAALAVAFLGFRSMQAGSEASRTEITKRRQAREQAQESVRIRRLEAKIRLDDERRAEEQALDRELAETVRELDAKQQAAKETVNSLESQLRELRARSENLQERIEQQQARVERLQARLGENSLPEDARVSEIEALEKQLGVREPSLSPALAEAHEALEVRGEALEREWQEIYAEDNLLKETAPFGPDPEEEEAERGIREAEDVQRHIKLLQREQAELETLRRDDKAAVEAHKGTLQEALHGALAGEPEDGPEAYRERLAGYQKTLTELTGLMSRYDDRKDRFSQVLEEATPEDIRKAAEEAEHKLAAGADDPVFAELTDNELSESLRRINRRIHEEGNALTALRTAIEDLTAQSRVPQAIDEELVQKTQELREAEEKLQAIELAIKLIEDTNELMQQTFGPKINEATTRFLAKLTGEPEQEVRVDNQFNLRVEDAETRSIKEHLYYSGGKIDQLYMALRLAIAETVYQDEESGSLPFFIDDAFIQYDSERALAAVRLFAELSEQGRQVIFTTCHDVFREKAESDGVTVNELAL